MMVRDSPPFGMAITMAPIVKKISDWGIKNSLGFTIPGRGGLLHAAVFKRDQSVLKELLVNNCQVNVKDHQGMTPLHRAAQIGDLGLIEILLNHGSDVHAKSNVGDSPLHSAVVGSPEVLDRLIQAGGNIDALNFQKKITCANFAGSDK